MDDSTPDSTTKNCKNYNINGRIMLTSVIVCFTFSLIFLIFFLYYRIHNNFSSTAHRFSRSLKPKGLSPFVTKSLPTFSYSSKTHEQGLECAVCLSEFQENHSGRVLPGCHHVFHVQCIDTWFVSHSDCPLCRTRVDGYDPVTRQNIPVTTGSDSVAGSCSAPEVAIDIPMEKVGTGSGSGENELKPT